MVKDIEAVMPLIGMRLEMYWLYQLLLLSPLRGMLKNTYSRFVTYGEQALERTKLA